MFDEYKVDRDALWAAMDAADVATCEVEFSGGGDEGGADRVELDGKECTDYESPLYELLARLPHERYYTFAGEFQVRGTIYVDRATQTIRIEGYESSWDSFETEL